MPLPPAPAHAGWFCPSTPVKWASVLAGKPQPGVTTGVAHESPAAVPFVIANRPLMGFCGAPGARPRRTVYVAPACTRNGARLVQVIREPAVGQPVPAYTRSMYGAGPKWTFAKSVDGAVHSNHTSRAMSPHGGSDASSGLSVAPVKTKLNEPN